MSEQRPPTSKEKRIINRLALEKYEREILFEGMRRRVHPLTDSKPLLIQEFRLPYPEEDVESTEQKTGRRSHQDLLVESLGGKCKVCGSVNDLEVHHVVPLEKGGPDTIQNLTVLCHECHVKTF